MKYSTLHKIMLLTVALVASLALGAQAGPALSTAKQTYGQQSGTTHSPGRIHIPFSTYMLDDGTAEDAIGLTVGGDIISLNEFAVIPGSETINSVEIAWGTPAFPDPSLDGLPYTVAIWSDPNGDGNPTDAVLLTTAGGVVSSQGTDTFLTTTVSPTTITTANFFVGFVITHSGGQFPSAFDETNPTFSNRSYVAGGASGDINNLNNNDIPVAPIESFGLVGNWLIRANSGGGGGGITLSATLRHQGGTRLVALSWSPADGGSINVLRDGAVIRTTDDDGIAQDNLGTGRREVHTYQVCETDTGTCSNEVEVRVPGSGG